MNAVHNPGLVASDVLMGLVITVLFAHNRLVWLYLEDLCFEDLGVIGNIEVIP